MRTRHIHFRATEEEFEQIRKQAHLAKLSTAQYVRNKTLDHTLNADDLRQVHFALSKLTNTYNQMANNRDKQAIGSNLTEVIEALSNLYRRVGG